MIDWDKTKSDFGVELTNYKCSSSICVVCDKCGKTGVKKVRKRSNIVDGQMDWLCMSCHVSKPEVKKKKSINSKKMWADKNIRNKIINSIDYNKISKKSKKNWQDDSYRNTMLDHIERNKSKLSELMKDKWTSHEYRSAMEDLYKTDEWRRSRSEIAKEAWSSDEYREHLSRLSKERWQNEEYRRRMAEVREKTYKVSNIQEILYSILEDLGIKYYREYNHKPNDVETKIGPYSFDCVVPLDDKKLLIECQGDYWHSLDGSKSKDDSKATYIEKYHNDCEIKYLWEHEFSCKDRIIEVIKYWCGLTSLKCVDFNFSDVCIKECVAADYKLLLSKYHYLPNAGRGGMAHGSFGAYLDDELIAVCVFSPLVRQNLPWDKETTRELSRLCIHPRYQKKNFASWFVSRCIKGLDIKYSTIISYCDTTFNHDGATYKACNFILDGEVKPDYWYVSQDGWVMHKKTLYNKASKMKMTEKEYAEHYGYCRVYGKEKLRFVFNR